MNDHEAGGATGTHSPSAGLVKVCKVRSPLVALSPDECHAAVKEPATTP